MNHWGRGGAENKREMLASSAENPALERYPVCATSVPRLATNHRNFSRSSGSSMAHDTLALIRRALLKGETATETALREAHNVLTAAVFQTNQSSIAHILFFLSASGTFCVPPTAIDRPQ